MIMWNTCYLCRYIRLYELLFGLLNSCFYCTSSCISNSTSIQGKRMFVPFLQNFLPCRLLLCNSCVRFPKLHILQPSGLYVCKNLYSYGHLIQRTLHTSEPKCLQYLYWEFLNFADFVRMTSTSIIPIMIWCRLCILFGSIEYKSYT